MNHLLTINDIMEFLKKNDIQITECLDSENGWELHWCSKAGEDMNETIYHCNSVDSIINAISTLAEDFDPEEHAKLYVNDAGENGVPTLKELVDDAYDIKGFLMNIASELINITKKNKELNSRLAQIEKNNAVKYSIVGVQFPGEDGICKKSFVDLINDCSGYYLDTIRIDGEHSSAMFVFDSEIYEKWLTNYRMDLFVDEIRDILDDKKKESPNGVYKFCGTYFKMTY